MDDAFKMMCNELKSMIGESSPLILETTEEDEMIKSRVVNYEKAGWMNRKIETSIALVIEVEKVEMRATKEQRQAG